MDMIFQHLANDSSCWNLAGLLPWGAPYADEEIFRWMGKLNRHYCIEGNTELLTADPAYRMDYELDHIDNGSFTDGLDGWTVLPGDKGRIGDKCFVQVAWPTSAAKKPARLVRDPARFLLLLRHRADPDTGPFVRPAGGHIRRDRTLFGQKLFIGIEPGAVQEALFVLLPVREAMVVSCR